MKRKFIEFGAGVAAAGAIFAATACETQVDGHAIPEQQTSVTTETTTPPIETTPTPTTESSTPTVESTTPKAETHNSYEQLTSCTYKLAQLATAQLIEQTTPRETAMATLYVSSDGKSRVAVSSKEVANTTIYSYDVELNTDRHVARGIVTAVDETKKKTAEQAIADVDTLGPITYGIDSNFSVYTSVDENGKKLEKLEGIAFSQANLATSETLAGEQCARTEEMIDELDTLTD
ncbi:hypothetical protein I8H83_03100 [Candidatus Saccharibacteria bacterium]|nr:hypothetical protein [Candidatus Saccharibacteria bacterium]MBH2007563.1 hypothetical protein [Candidatus Saccharibacteria bacterium]